MMGKGIPGDVRGDEKQTEASVTRLSHGDTYNSSIAQLGLPLKACNQEPKMTESSRIFVGSHTEVGCFQHLSAPPRRDSRLTS
jgi:hypothetical protein